MVDTGRPFFMTTVSSNPLNFAVVAFALIFLIACNCPSVRDGQKSAPRTSSTKSNDNGNSGSEKTTSEKADLGDFVVESSQLKNDKFRRIHESFRESKTLEKAADKLNRALKLPRDIKLRTKDCGDVNAFYSPRDHSITFCYELMDYFYKLYKLDGDNDAKANERMEKAMTFVFLHEVGHALIDNYDLPITGNEEDAADRCSAYICIEELGATGVEAILAAADAFSIESRLTRKRKKNLADEHLLQEQRFFNALCMVYGSNPAKYDYLRKNKLLPDRRARRCPNEYGRMARSWGQLLRPWRKG